MGFLIRCEYDILIGSIHFWVFYSVNPVILSIHSGWVRVYSGMYSGMYSGTCK